MGNFNLDINETYSAVFKKVNHSRAIFASEPVLCALRNTEARLVNS